MLFYEEFSRAKMMVLVLRPGDQGTVNVSWSGPCHIYYTGALSNKVLLVTRSVWIWNGNSADPGAVPPLHLSKWWYSLLRSLVSESTLGVLTSNYNP